MGKNRNRHKSKRKQHTPNTNNLGDFMTSQGINIKELKRNLKDGKKKTNEKTI